MIKTAQKFCLLNSATKMEDKDLKCQSPQGDNVDFDTFFLKYSLVSTKLMLTVFTVNKADSQFHFTVNKVDKFSLFCG